MLPTAMKSELSRLYTEQIAREPEHSYLRYHAAPQAIASKIASFEAYRPFVPTSGTILDWGCQHAPDSVMLRAAFGSSPEIVGCDFLPVDRYPVFWNASGLRFVPLDHTTHLPFPDASFDMVVGAGVLEHAAQDYESLKELYRVTKPGGFLAITHLPNRLSYAEFIARNFRKAGFHRRLYSVASLRDLLQRTGFHPVKLRRHRVLPSNALPRVTAALSGLETTLDRIWPINLFAGDILAVAQKVDAF